MQKDIGEPILDHAAPPPRVARERDKDGDEKGSGLRVVANDLGQVRESVNDSGPVHLPQSVVILGDLLVGMVLVWGEKMNLGTV